MDDLQYLDYMRKKGITDAEITKKLIAGGWLKEEIDNLFTAADDTVPPPPHTRKGSTQAVARPTVNTLQNHSTYGEYAIMFLALAFGAISLGVTLHSLIDAYFNNGSAFDYGSGSSFAAITAFITIPIFTLLFLRLARKERAEPALRKVAARRLGIQLSLIISFIWGIITLAMYIYNLVYSLSGGPVDTYAYGQDNRINPGQYQLQQLLHTLVTLCIAGGVFVYYWIDEHRR